MNHVSDKYLIVYYSLSGNTKRISEIIEENLISRGKEVTIFPLTNQSIFGDVDIEVYNHVFIGSPTYGYGKTPGNVRKFLRYLLIENTFKLPTFSVFGSGETQWEHYCRAVDELEFHLSKATNVLSKLKIEQYPINPKQKMKISDYTYQILK
ncbi:flavodoxin domain-containing protein [Niallia taxi]|uniref:flavodoxin domain-containing protein n=1 Tax=Niallia taxi TaxID=2499688 RepID=UPI00317878A7